jgi:hypothetical protein
MAPSSEEVLKMSKWMFLILATAAFGLLLCCSLVSAQEKGETYEVDIVHEEEEWRIEPCPMPGLDGDTWRIRNLSSDTVCVMVKIMVKDGEPFLYTLAPMDSTDHLISVWDCGIIVSLGVCPFGPFLVECSHPCGSALTQGGTVALVITLTSVTVWVLLRKKTRYQTSV